MAEKRPLNPAAVAMLEDVLTLSRATAQPFYQQIEQQIARLIDDGVLAEGSTLPAERSLATALGVSRATVQQSYNALRASQRIRGHGRHGSIVLPRGERLSPGMDRLRGFTQEMRELGRTPSTRILEHQITTDRAIASLFGLHSDARFVRLVRIRLGDDVPLSLESAWYSLSAAPALAEADPMLSMYDQMTANGVTLAFCDQTVEATMPSTREREIFDFTEAVPCLLIKRRTYGRDNVMVEYVEGLFRGDAYSYRLRLDA